MLRKDRPVASFMLVIALLAAFVAPLIDAAGVESASEAAELQAQREGLRELDRVRGPTEVAVVGSSKLKMPLRVALPGSPVEFLAAEHPDSRRVPRLHALRTAPPASESQ
ncbi:MAG: hypothetical protein ABIT36_01395 [Steroidobacteraceae bacterium]